jgi:uncharacterized protein (TIGR02145 family)
MFTLAFCESFAQKEGLKTVIIGNQEWMVMNLDVDTFRNGDSLFEAKNSLEWIKMNENRTPAWCYANFNQKMSKYGKIYNAYALEDLRGLSPKGFKVPADSDWTNLISYLGGDGGDNELGKVGCAGKKLKSKNWKEYTWKGYQCIECEADRIFKRKKRVRCRRCNGTGSRVFSKNELEYLNGDNSSGFNALQIESIHFNGTFGNIDNDTSCGTSWWAYSTEKKYNRKYFTLNSFSHSSVLNPESFLYDSIGNKLFGGHFIRCLKESEIPNPIVLLNFLVGKWKISENSWSLSTLTSQGSTYDDSYEDTELGKVWEIELKLISDSLIIMGMHKNFSRLIDSNIRNIGNIEQDSIFFIGFNNKVNLVNLNLKDHSNILYLSDNIYLSNDQSSEFNRRNENRNKLIGDSFTNVSYMSIKPKSESLNFSDVPRELELEFGRLTRNKPVTINFADFNPWYIDFRRKYILMR